MMMMMYILIYLILFVFLFHIVCSLFLLFLEVKKKNTIFYFSNLLCSAIHLQRMEPAAQYNMVFGGKYICKHNLRCILTDYRTNVNFKVRNTQKERKHCIKAER